MTKTPDSTSSGLFWRRTEESRIGLECLDQPLKIRTDKMLAPQHEVKGYLKEFFAFDFSATNLRLINDDFFE